ncbi:DNA-binding MarR family transcriptional regulator [Saccharothrix coeruleofusca]|uniref:MarR family winged helix-turn-helix transcriptional regulator n=1 Tax=Saccharothrix coeruleofusca TaxID=33919 RepID=UPI001AE1D1F6|nr:MarR family winged helix-turn-helix transcriptional regulator [Saccharothrix coeruleofusca]MBP2338591.1 DNA-binding MarR family transcriptional regulator [Saccharothrix coeruleofusca]
MTEVRELSADEDALWRALGRVVHVLPRLLDEDMTKATGLSMTEYAVLHVLAEAPEHRLRMTELASATALSASRMTRVVDGLARYGLVTKEKPPGDARGSAAVLTGEGLRRQREAAPRHTASARRRVLDHVPPEDLAAAVRVLQRLADHTSGS